MIPDSQDCIRVSIAKERYFGGRMSLRWWYRQIESGKLPHFRAGTAIVLRVADVEAFIASLYREQVQPAPEPPVEPVEAPRPRSARRSGLRFFN